ncbi:MAG TPA: TIGR00159 family protein [Candidatus Eisenbacteria bacterium]|uniref:Diadenylate cyclase n=1 Tax=Eiseniibacteriota bacterium TaxID=2212470 RepID=A0A7V2AVC7_UNCEI|nr:TIGR00159 family protein [Candidatus Eisenbacteria bacterium]
MSSFHFKLTIDVLDIIIVAFLFYRLLLLVKGTRATQMFVGLFLLIILSFFVQWLNLNALNWILSSLKTVWVIAFVILFQPELRRALTQLGQNRIMGFFIKVEESGTVSEIVKACHQLVQNKLGAIIVIEQDVGLRNYIETGTPLDAKVTSELLVTVFTPPGPLHDGAVIVEKSRVIAAGCILPLSQNPRLAKSLGTRHRAGLGLSEESDAIVIIVSEETGAISLAVGGKLKRKLDINTLRNDLIGIIGIKPEEAAAAAS